MAVQDQKDPARLEQEAKALYRASRYQQAAELFSESALYYTRQGELLLAAEMKNNQCVSLLKAKQPGPALEAVQGTNDTFAAAGDQEKQAMSLANQATALEDLGRPDQALDLFSEAAELFRENHQPELYLETVKSISALKLKARDLPGALFSMQKGLQGQKKLTLTQKILLNLLKIPLKLLER